MNEDCLITFFKGLDGIVKATVTNCDYAQFDGIYVFTDMNKIFSFLAAEQFQRARICVSNPNIIPLDDLK